MSNTSKLGGTPVKFEAPALKPAPRFDADEIERLHAIARDFYQPGAMRTDALVEPPSAEDLAAMLAFISWVDGADTIPEKHRTDPTFLCGIAIGSARRAKNVNYMARKRVTS